MLRLGFLLHRPWTLTPLLLLALLVGTPAASAASACGGYRDSLGPGQSIAITSPNYPSPYPRNHRCIWLFAATAGTAFVVNVTSANLEGSGNNATGCGDFLQLTDGSSRSSELAYLCQVASPVQFTATKLYLWIKFQSNHQVQNSGFDLTVSTVADSSAQSNSTPIVSCNITRYTCPNKECVYQGSICDNVNDCGCDEYGCDETKCWKFELLNDLSFVWGIGTGVGLVVSISAFIICGFLEMPDRKRPECLKRNLGCGGGCLERCSRKNRVQQQTPEAAFKAMMERMTGGAKMSWDAADTDSEAAHSTVTSRSVTPRTSLSGPGSPSMSRRSSTYAQQQQQQQQHQQQPGPAASTAVYGKTLSPKDSLKFAAGASPRQPLSPGPKTLAVPSASTA